MKQLIGDALKRKRSQMHGRRRIQSDCLRDRLKGRDSGVLLIVAVVGVAMVGVGVRAVRGEMTKACSPGGVSS